MSKNDLDDPLQTVPRTNEFTMLLLDVLESAAEKCTEPIQVRVPLGPRLAKASKYTRQLKKEHYHLKKKTLNGSISDREIYTFALLSKLLRLSTVEDIQKATSKTFAPFSQMTDNEVFKIARIFNPKDKCAIGRCGDFTPDQLLEYFVLLQTRDSLPVDPDLDI